MATRSSSHCSLEITGAAELSSITMRPIAAILSDARFGLVVHLPRKLGLNFRTYVDYRVSGLGSMSK